MELKDIVYCKDVILQIVWGTRIIEFHTNPVGTKGEGLLITPYLHDGKPLELTIDPHSGVVCNIFATDLEKNARLSWRNLEMKTMTYQNQTVYFLSNTGYNRFSKIEERRQHTRMPIQLKGYVEEEAVSESRITVVVDNISDNGIGFYVPLHFAPESRKLVVFLNDTVNDHSFELKIKCAIVREQDLADKKFIGCQIDDASQDFLIYGCLKRVTHQKGNLQVARSTDALQT